MPARIQRRRTAGWRAPLDAQGRKPVYVGRGSHFGNPFRVVGEPRASVDLFRDWLLTGAVPADWEPGALDDRRTRLLAHLGELRGRDLMCWCAPPKPGEPDHCHARLLLDVANTPDTTR